MSELNEAIAREYLDTKLAETIRITGKVVPGLETQMGRLVADHFKLDVGHDGRPQLVTKSGQPASEVLGEKLADPDFKHFLIPSGPGATVDAQLRAIVSRARESAAPGLLGNYGR